MTNPSRTPSAQTVDQPPSLAERCEHVAFVGYPARCDLDAGHEGDHRGREGTRHGWSHAAGAPSYDPARRP